MPVQQINKVAHLLAGKQSYIVGGFIRDKLLGRESNDVDIAVEGDAISIARQVAKVLEGNFVLLDDVNSVARVVMPECNFDLSSFSQSIEVDLARRDFTIDAMATPLEEVTTALPAKLIDPFHGREDLENKIVRAVSEGIFEVDAARLLRAVRLAAELDFTIEPQTELLIHRYSQYMAKVPGERVREELLRLFRLPQCAQQLRYLDSLGLLLAVVPELKEGKTVEPPGLYFENVFHHSLETVAALQFLIRENDWEYGNRDILAVTPWADFVAGHLSEDFSSEMSRLAGLKIAALLHDIAKPKTKFVDASGKMHFYGHAKEGAEMAADILRRLRFSNREISLIKCLIYHHLRPAQLIGKELPTRRAIYRYFRDTGDAGIDILFLALADYLATCGPLVDMEQWGEYCWLASYIVAEHAVPARATPPKLINGHDVINLFGLKPGPLIGKLLDMVREAQASGEISTKEEAIALLQKELESHALSRS